MKSSSLPIITSTYGASRRLTSCARAVAADGLPQAGPVVQVVGDDGAVPRGAAIASSTTSGVVVDSAAKMPPVWNQRTPCGRRGAPSRRPRPQLARRGVTAVGDADRAAYTEAALGEVEPVADGAADAVVRRPTGLVRSTPPWQIRSSTSRPTSLSASAVTTAVRRPKQRRSPRATLYSPPPSQTWNAARSRCGRRPGSSRSITSPSATAS